MERSRTARWVSAIAWIGLLLCALTPVVYPATLEPGQYTDYIWQTDYRAPTVPASVPINCSFFVSDERLCQSIANIRSASGREAVLLATIRQTSPESNQEITRLWESTLPIGDYYEPVAQGTDGQSDGAWGENGSLRNTWFRLLKFYPSVYDPKDGYFYLSDQTLMQTTLRTRFVVPNPVNGSWCAQSYNIKGYDVVLTKTLRDYSTTGRILPTAQLLGNGERANLTLALDAAGEYQYQLSSLVGAGGAQASGSGEGANGTGSEGARVCQEVVNNHTIDTLHLTQTYPVKRYPDTFAYTHTVSIPSSGFAQGLVSLDLPADFLSYTIRIKDYTYTVSRNDLKLVRRGESAPLLQLQLTPAPGKSGTLHVSSINETEQGGTYHAQIRYKLPIQTPNLGQSDCSLRVVTPFEVRQTENACQTTRSQGSIALSIARLQDGAGLVQAKLVDAMGNPLEGIDVVFSTGDAQWTKTTDPQGVAQIWIPQTSGLRQIQASTQGTQEVSETQNVIFLPGLGQYSSGEKTLTQWLWEQAPILLILVLVSTLMVWLVRRRSSAVLVLILVLAALLAPIWAQNATSLDEGASDLQNTLSACQSYDFDNAVRHFGECAQSYQLASEFNSMRRTAVVLIANIAPLVVATPDITPYKSAYANMVLIALALFRVAWAFNSLYLILNIFNPAKRNEVLKQYIWLIVFVIFVYFSFGIMREGINAVNNVSTWIAGTDAASTLTQASLSAQFVSENYEMLKLMLPFLNLTYLILLARYVSVIAMMLFFPFALLLFFTSATRGFGRAALTVTFAGLGLGIINAILLLIYSILTKTADPTLSGSFAATFFSASFIVFFGFVNLLVLVVAFLSGIVFIGQRSEA